MLALVDLEELVQRCRSANAQAYIKEAVDCYRIGAYRACVIVTWIALVYDFIDKLRELSLGGDKAAAKRVAEFDQIQKARDTDAALKFEREVLTMAKDEFELITIQEMTDLARLFDDRNRCGHPNLNRDTEIYAPPPELARLHLRAVIEHVLERPPVQGKAALTMLRQTVDSDYFPVIITDAEQVLKATPLPRAKINVVREFLLGALVSVMREALPEKKMLQRLAAAQVTQHLHPATASSLLQEKFDEAVFKTPDESLTRVIWLLASEPDLQPLLKEATWVKLENLAKAIPTADFGAVLNALAIPRLRQFGLARLGTATKAELSAAAARLRGKPDDAFIDKCIAVYDDSTSFDSANTMAKEVITPLIAYFSPIQAQAVIEAGKNGQVRESNEYPGVVSDIKDSGTLSEKALADVICNAGLKSRLGRFLPPDPPQN
jgi:hypothetical protein